MKPSYQTPRLHLRPITSDDFTALCDMDSDPEVMRYINGGYADSPEAIERWLQRILQQYKETPWGFWTAEERETGAFAGWFHMYPSLDSRYGRKLGISHEGDIALGYRLRREYWGKGLATEGSHPLLQAGFQEWDFDSVVAWALAGNAASSRVMEKLGLQKTGDFEFFEAQLPRLPNPEQRKGVFYRLLRKDWNARSGNQVRR